MGSFTGPALAQWVAQNFIRKPAARSFFCFWTKNKSAHRDSFPVLHTTPSRPSFIIPKMASTMPSFSTSMDPEQTKKMAWRASPCRRRYSPGAQKEVLMCSDRERRQPRLAEANSDSSRISLLRCMVMSDRSSSGKSFSSCEDDGREKGREWGSRQEEPCQLWKHKKMLQLSFSCLWFLIRTSLSSQKKVFAQPQINSLLYLWGVLQFEQHMWPYNHRKSPSKTCSRTCH